MAATILVIDDDVALLASLSGQLEQAGYTVLKASEASHAELIMVEQRPALVVLEVRTSREAGWDLLQRFAAQAPVMVVSASSREEDVVRGMEMGAVDYIAKPYRSAELLTRVRSRLKQSGAVNGVAPTSPLAVAAAPPPVAAPPPLPRAAHADRRDTSDPPESVFMTEAEELALLRAGTEGLPNRRDMLAQDGPRTDAGTLGQQLHAERQRRRLTLVQVENELKIRMSYLQAMEDDKFTLLPRGPLAGQMLRSYATYLGLETTPLMEEYKRLHATEAIEPSPSLGAAPRPRRLPGWVVWLTAIGLALALGFGAIFYFDPNGLNTMANNLRALIVFPASDTSPPPALTPAPTPAPTAAPTLAPAPTVAPTATPTPTLAPTAPVQN